MKFRMLLTAATLQLGLLLLAGQAFAAKPAPQTETPKAADADAKKDAKDKDKEKEDPAKIKPYKDVITAEAVSDPGVFTVHTIASKAKTYYEIPRSELGKDFLWVTQIAKNTLGRGYGGEEVNERVVRWEQRDKRVLLREVQYDMTADPALPVALAVQAANYSAIIMAFNIEAFGADQAPVIEVSKLFTTEVPEFSVRTRLSARGFDSARSFVEHIKAFPTNIEVSATQTYTAPPGESGGGGNTSGPAPMKPGSASVLMHYSMVKLPEKPMMPRVFDQRVGYFTIQQEDYGRNEHRAVQRTYITRYRLEKKDPNAALSEPVKPIVYWIDPATPTKWIPYIKKGIEDWQPAFEAAGFKNAIIAKDAPTPQEDPEWSPEDARYSVIRWLPSTTENAMGPHVSDPRTGEILEADVQFYHNIMSLLSKWYFVQVAPLDPRVRTLPMPDDLMGELLRYVVAHEIGHTLGFQHNMKASSMYPADKVRDREWLHTMGHVATLMDYSRFNYVVQPEDGIPAEDLIPKIGPYDKWATHWGYAPIPGAKTPDEEKATLDAWAREQEKTPWLRFSTADAAGSDPGDETEAVGDADPIASTTLGLKNLARVAQMLLPATSSEPGESWDMLKEFYERMLSQWSVEMSHVANLVGGFDSQQRNVGQEGVRFTPVSRARQAAAVAFLNENAFTPMQFAIRPEISARIEPTGTLDRIGRAQAQVLMNVLGNQRIQRVIEQAALYPDAYKPTELLADVREGIWHELSEGRVEINSYRRNLQRAHLNLLSQRVADATATNDSRALFRGELMALDNEAARAVRRSRDEMTRLHLEDVRAQIKWALNPDRPLAAQEPQPQGGRRGASSSANQLLDCWKDQPTFSGR